MNSLSQPKADGRSLRGWRSRCHTSVSGRRFSGSLAKVVGVVVLVYPQVGRAWSPGISQPDAVGSPVVPLTVDSMVRNDVVSFFHCIYDASEGGNAEIGWTGNRDGCIAGTTSEGFKDNVRRRINWFRAMSGMPADIVFNPAFNAAAQEAALIMAQEQDLSHNPAADFGKVGCWTQTGQTGASRGNLFLGLFGVPSIDGYIDDYGVDDVGHRAWILHARATTMGTGDIPEAVGEWLPPSNCLYVMDEASRRAAGRRFYSWPPAGFVPAGSVYPLWSLQFDTANFGSPAFGAASVAMTLGAANTPVPLVVRHRYRGGALAGAPSIVWEPNWSAWGGFPPLETPIKVTVTGITAGASGSGTSHTYTVTAIDPYAITDPLKIKGPETPSASGAVYDFDALAGVPAERYDLGVARLRKETVVEGAESQPAPRVVDGTSDDYPLFSTPGNGLAAQAGQQCFHLTLSNFSETRQSFELDYDLVPGTAASLGFYRRYGAVTDGTRFSVLVWSDADPGWKELLGRNGQVGSGWTQETIPLGAHAGKSIRVRFQLEWREGSAFIGTSPDYGMLIDSIAVTGCEYNEPYIITPLSADARQFTLNAATAGSALTSGSEWFLRIRPTLGLHTFPFAAPLRVTVAPSPDDYRQWLTTRHPTLTPSGFGDDADGDGWTNGVEYSFGLDPTMAGGTPPGLTLENGSWLLAFDPATLPYSITDMVYAVEASVDLVSWSNVTAETVGSRLVFRLPTGNTQYARWRLSKTP